MRVRRPLTLLVVLCLTGCAGRRVDQFQTFADAGARYAQAMVTLTEEAGAAAIDADSAVLERGRPDWSQQERAEKLQAHDEKLRTLLDVLGDLRKQTTLLQRYFIRIHHMGRENCFL